MYLKLLTELTTICGFFKLQNRSIHLYLIRILHFWFFHQSMLIKGGSEVSEVLFVSNGVRQGEILSPVLLNLYLDDLFLALCDYNIGCMVGNHLLNHLMYVDDLVILSLYSSGLQLLLSSCTRYGGQFDMFNLKESVVMISRI